MVIMLNLNKAYFCCSAFQKIIVPIIAERFLISYGKYDVYFIEIRFTHNIEQIPSLFTQ